MNNKINVSDVGCYTHFPEDEGKWCSNWADMWNICDGTYIGCVSKGKELCENDSTCYGVMAHEGLV